MRALGPVSALALIVSAGAVPVRAEPLTFEAALSRAASDAPDLRATALGVEAAEASVTAAGQLPDPRLAFGLDGFPVSGPAAGRFGEDSFTALRVGIEQDLPSRARRRADPARQAAAVLLTNTAVPVHVADIIAAIGRMLQSKLTIEVIARALGYAEIEIKRLAVLAGLPSAAIVALKSGRMTLKQAKLLARLPDKAEQEELAEAALDGHGFQDWRIIERLDDARVTTRDRRCALVDPQAYGAAGGRTETDLFGELVPVLLDPDILTEVWTRRARGIAAVFEAEGIAVHVTAGPEPELPDDLEALGYVAAAVDCYLALSAGRGARNARQCRAPEPAR